MESVALTNQSGGSVPGAGHTLARTVVGEVPVTWRRIRSGIPAVYVKPVTERSVEIEVCMLPTSLVSSTVTLFADVTRAPRARYSLPAEIRRPVAVR